MIRQIHLNDCDSTQDVLKEQLSEGSTFEHVLVSCERQLKGRGRGDNTWIDMPGTLCFSLSLTGHPVPSFTALELSVLVARFFETKGKELFLKWPNDLWDSRRKKVCGILIQNTSQTMLAGVGLNLFTADDDFGGIYEAPFEMDKKTYARELAEFIIGHRYPDATLLRRDWEQRCGHLGKKVQISEGRLVTEGIFTGLGDFGEAVVMSDEQHRLFNGTLRLL